MPKLSFVNKLQKNNVTEKIMLQKKIKQNHTNKKSNNTCQKLGKKVQLKA